MIVYVSVLSRLTCADLRPSLTRSNASKLRTFLAATPTKSTVFDVADIVTSLTTIDAVTLMSVVPSAFCSIVRVSVVAPLINGSA